MTSKDIAKPFLKWAGGKKQLLPEIQKNYPQELLNDKIDAYIEPFLGGGAVLFDILNNYNVENITVNDINQDLIYTYLTVRDNCSELIALLHLYENEYHTLDDEQRKVYYYDKRSLYNKVKLKNSLFYNENEKDIVLLASLLIFLNRTCFNGLYRLNRKGEFNVPIGNYKNPQICNAENLKNVSKSIQKVNFLCESYYDLDINSNIKTFIYLDPPYRALPNTPSFTTYFSSEFGEQEQINLANWIVNTSSENTYVLTSNSDPHNTDEKDDFFLDNYKELTPISSVEKVFAKRNINSNAKKRGQITELLIKNYE